MYSKELDSYEATRRLLSAVELLVLHYLAQGQTNKNIAKSLNDNHGMKVTERAVEAHVSNILGKTSFKNRTELTYWECKYFEIGQ
jgi:DNA-binding NarL/FixJ family response regulator